MTAASLQLRAMSAADLELVFALACAIPDIPHWPLDDYRKMVIPCSGDFLQRFALVASFQEQFAGFTVATLLEGENCSEMEMVAVPPGFRRRGIGSALLYAAMEVASQVGAERMRLEVRRSNDAALALYKRHGFQETGRRQAYYSAPPEDALLLEVPLRRVP